jgi:UDP-glucose 4-epimerase
MPQDQTIMITGVSSYWGRRVAERLLAEPGVRVLGLDSVSPEGALPGLTYLPGDVRRRDLPETLIETGVTAICHLAFRQSDEHTADTFDYNVMGAINVFGAAAKADVRRLVAMSSASVYGAREDNPALLTEEAPLRGSRDVPVIRYQIELEQFFRQFRQTAPATRLAILRLAHVVGPTADSPMARYLADPWTPVLLGADPLLQFIHEDDAAEALVRALLSDVEGPINVAARPSLPLSAALALVRKVPVAVPRPLASWGQAILAERGKQLPLPLDALRYPALVDTARIADDLDFLPARTAIVALRDFGAAHEQPVASLLRGRLAGRQSRQSRE